MSNEKEIVHQKEVADKVLALVEKCDPTCIVAGGAPRDWYLGNPANDIDLFCYLRGDITMGRKVRWLESSTGLKLTERGPANSIQEQYKMNPHLGKVLDTEYDGVKVQIMIMNKPTYESVVPHFPFSICKAWYKGGKIRLDHNFKLTIASKVIFSTGETYSDEHKYIQKIKNRFRVGYRFGSRELAESIVVGNVLREVGDD